MDEVAKALEPIWATKVETATKLRMRVEAVFDAVHISSLGDMGALHARVAYRATGPTGETLRWMHNRLSWVVVRFPDGWRVTHEHTSVPIGPDLKGVLQGE